MTTTNNPPADPATLQPRLQAALALHQQGQLAPARAQYEAILRDFPQQPDALHLLGVVALQSGDAATAVTLIGQAIAAFPRNPEFHLHQAIALQTQGRADDALAAFDRALAIDPAQLNAHISRAQLLKTMNRLDEAAASYERVLALQPGIAEVHYNLGNIRRELGNAEAAAASFEQAATLRPDFVQAHVNRGIMLLQLDQPEAAQNCFERALALDEKIVEAQAGRADALLAQLRLEEAIAGYDRALALRPGNADALRNRGKALYSATQDSAAVASLEAALALEPNDAEAWLFLGCAYERLHRSEAALAALDRAIALVPDDYRAWAQKSNLLFHQGHYEAATACRTEALRLRPDSVLRLGELLTARMHLCDWTDFDSSLARLAEAIEQGEPALMPIPAQSMLDAPALLLEAARIVRPTLRLPPHGDFPPAAGTKIRLGYFSADFRNHPVSQLMARIFEEHDRARFELIAFSFGPPARDPLRQRVEKAFDRFFDVAERSDQDIVALARAQGIDIAVDLGGHTQFSRPAVFARRVAPVQVGYIGFLGSMGADWMDYLIADPVLIPPEQREHYSEKIVALPWYQANEARQASSRVFSRAELGLPATGVVLACLNNHFKITPAVFDSWMRILTAVPDSVLYLLVGPEVARRNLRAAAAARGVDGARLVFAERVPPADYLARFRVVDLFLDTWPCNAGATASDALYMDVPVLTCRGQGFASRMAASVLTALEMPELITSSPEEYERRAIALARAPDALAALKRKVEAQRQRAPLYDTARFTRYLEAGFRAMHDRRTAGLAPDDIVIET